MINLNDLMKSLEADAQIEKKASDEAATKPAVSSELAGILEKKASEDVSKAAFAQGEALAKALLEKLANEIQAGNDAMVADDDTKVVANPGGTVEQVLQGVVDNATASGATTEDRVNHEAKVDNVDPAFLQGSEKSAQEATSKTEEIKEEKTMDKIASDSQLAKHIMEKLAQEFSATATTPAAAVNVAATAAPNKIQQDNAVMTAQDDAKVVGVVPGGDGTVNALFESIVAKAKADGGQTDDLINGPGTVVSDPIFTDAQEKAAAVSELCSAGMDFETAVALVKQAETEILGESWEQEKQACFNMLVAEGVDFDTAIALIKQAEEDLAKQGSAE